MKASEIRDWDDVEIRARLGELREERFRLRFRMGTMQLENPKLVKHIRRDVARLNTILRERELSQTSGTSELSETSEAPEAPETSEAPLAPETPLASETAE
jgi:large subunit ribosomal protein L29